MNVQHFKSKIQFHLDQGYGKVAFASNIIVHANYFSASSCSDSLLYKGFPYSIFFNVDLSSVKVSACVELLSFLHVIQTFTWTFFVHRLTTGVKAEARAEVFFL